MERKRWVISLATITQCEYGPEGCETNVNDELVALFALLTSPHA
jgi:hypothetical protein